MFSVEHKQRAQGQEHTCQPYRSDVGNTQEYVNYTSDDRNTNNNEYPCREMSGRIGGVSAGQIIQAVSRSASRIDEL